MKSNCGSGLTQQERTALVAAVKKSKDVFLNISHYGIDETGKPEIPVMKAFTISSPSVGGFEL